MRRRTFHFIWVAVLSGCGQSRDPSPTGQSALQPQRKSAYCFFKKEEMKGWAAHRYKGGNIILTGQAHVKDPRYKAVLGEPSQSGANAEIAPSISQNDSAYGARDDWWDLKATIANSQGIGDVTVRCGDKVVAELKVMPRS